MRIHLKEIKEYYNKNASKVQKYEGKNKNN